MLDVTDDMKFSFKSQWKKFIYEISLISAGDSNTHLSVNVYLTTYADYVNTLFDYFSCHQSHPIKVGSFNKIAFNINNWPQTIFYFLYLDNIKVRQPTNTKISIYICYWLFSLVSYFIDDVLKMGHIWRNILVLYSYSNNAFFCLALLQQT